MTQKLQKLLAAMTPGRWVVFRDGTGCRSLGIKHGKHRQAQHHQVVFTAGLSDQAEDKANAAGIVALKNSAEALLVVVEAARASNPGCDYLSATRRSDCLTCDGCRLRAALVALDEIS